MDIINFPDVFSGQANNIYESFGISDWLINYQAGFVRRGLAGEILYHIYQWHPYNIVYAIIIIDIVCLIGLTCLCVWLFRNIGWPLWLLLFPMFLYYSYYGLGWGLLGVRRDPLMLLLAFFLFYQYKSYLRNGGIRIGIVWTLSILILLLHEGMFFCIFPFLLFHTFMYYKHDVKIVIRKFILIWWPAILVLLVIISVKPSLQAPAIIWDSWSYCFERYPFAVNLPDIGIGVAWITHSLASNIKFAFSQAWLTDIVGGIPAWPFNIYLLAAIYYLLTRMDILNAPHQSNSTSRIQISCIFILQLLFVMPMLGFVAHDWFRSIPYVCITTCFLYYLFPDIHYIPHKLIVFSTRLQEYINSSKLLCNQWCYLIVLLTLPLAYFRAGIGGMFPFLPMDVKSSLMVMVSSL